MTLIQEIDLGSTGDEINCLLSEIKEAITNPDEFDDKANQLEYINDTIGMIKIQLTNLKEK